MTLASANNRNEYTGDCTRTIFPYTFRILDQAHLDVYVDCTLQTITTHYSVTNAGSVSGGNVVMVTAPNRDKSVVIVRDVPVTQTTDYVEGSRFPAESHEKALDKLTMIAQQHAEKLGRAIKLPVTSTLENIDFPVPGASSFIRWNAAGTALETATITATGVATATLIASTRAALGKTDEAGTLRRVSNDVRGVWMSTGSRYFSISGEIMNLQEFGAVGDGVTDDTKALEAMLAVGGHMYVPPGTYLTRPVEFKSKSWLQGAGMGRSIIKAEAGLPNNNRVLNVCRVFDVIISDLEVDGNGPTAASGQQNHNILILEACNVWVERIRSRNSQGDSIAITSNTGGRPSCNIHILHNDLTDIGRIHVTMVGAGVCDIWIVGNRMTPGTRVKTSTSEGGGIDLEPSPNTIGGLDLEGIRILDNDITEGVIAISRKYQDFVVRDVVIRGNRIDAKNLDWEARGKAGINLSRIQNFIVDGNILIATATCRPGIRLVGVENRTCEGVISRNIIRGWQSGIHVTTCTNNGCLSHIRITDNHIQNSSCSDEASINVYNVEDLQVLNNFVQGENLGHGIRVSSSREFLVAGNIIQDVGGTQGINLTRTVSQGQLARGLIIGNVVKWTNYSSDKIGIGTLNCSDVTEISITGNDLQCTGTAISLGAAGCNVYAWGNRTCSAGVQLMGNSGSLFRQLRWARAASVADGGTVTHGLGGEPTAVFVQATTSGEFASVTAVSSTTFTVAIKKHDGTGGTTAALYWTAQI